ncbi:unnamed protein product, partial [Symbiodinium sp. CCMP2592]
LPQRTWLSSSGSSPTTSRPRLLTGASSRHPVTSRRSFRPMLRRSSSGGTVRFNPPFCRTCASGILLSTPPLEALPQRTGSQSSGSSP